MAPPALHDPSNPPVTERLVCSERTFLHGTFKFPLEALDQPVNFQVNACVDEGVEVAAGVF
jgi:hypothetical protein